MHFLKFLMKELPWKEKYLDDYFKDIVKLDDLYIQRVIYEIGNQEIA
jgi:hypothetical protein